MFPAWQSLSGVFKSPLLKPNRAETGREGKRIEVSRNQNQKEKKVKGVRVSRYPDQREKCGKKMSRNTKIALWIIGTVLAVFVLAPMVWWGFAGRTGGWGMMGSWAPGWGGLMMIPMVLFWALVIWGIVWLVRSAGGGHAHYHTGQLEQRDSALEILKTRYAKGEISKAEFEEKKKDIS